MESSTNVSLGDESLNRPEKGLESEEQTPSQVVEFIVQTARSPESLIEAAKSPDKVAEAMQSIVRLCRGRPTNLLVFGRSANKFFPSLERVLRATLASSLVAEPALHAIRFLCRHADEKGSQNLDNVLSLGESGACGVVVQILLCHGANSAATLAEGGFHAVRNLSSDPTNSQQLGACGACEVVVTLLRKFGFDNMFIAVIGLGSVCNLSIEPENCTMLGIAGACELLVQLLKKHGMKSASLSAVGLGAIWDVSYESVENRQLLCQAGACEVAVDILLTHVSPSSVNQMVALTGSKVIFNLSRDKGGVGAAQLLALNAVYHLETLVVENANVISEEARAFAREAIERLAPKQSNCSLS